MASTGGDREELGWTRPLTAAELEDEVERKADSMEERSRREIAAWKKEMVLAIRNLQRVPVWRWKLLSEWDLRLGKKRHVCQIFVRVQAYRTLISPASLRTESTQSTGSSSSKQEVRPPRLKKLTRQFSFNHSDEDDLPPALAAVAAESAAEHRAALLLASNGNSQASSIEKSPRKASSSFTLEPGDLLMDFTEAIPMIKAYPGDPSNSFFDPYTTVQEYPVDLLDTPLEQYSAEPSPKRHSPAIHMVTPRQLMNQEQTMQTTHSLHSSKADSSEGLRRELEREKMMKRLLMTEL
ncbi:band 4.1-like protein 4B [Anomaloglossus baeobatrachus]|uniref:band 4.1-like protein 4B n=1 Tax=Anomaloglossus baeobatrachus TaxID=238106 RepID=UPI003F500213